MVAETIGSRCACTFNHSGDSVMTVRRWIGWLAMAVVATLLLVLLAQNMGRERAMHDIERMNLVFGDVFRYSDHERALMVAAALACDLSSVPKQAAAVSACLRAGVASTRFHPPKGVENAAQQFEELLKRALDRGAARDTKG